MHGKACRNGHPLHRHRPSASEYGEAAGLVIDAADESLRSPQRVIRKVFRPPHLSFNHFKPGESSGDNRVSDFGISLVRRFRPYGQIDASHSQIRNIPAETLRTGQGTLQFGQQAGQLVGGVGERLERDVVSRETQSDVSIIHLRGLPARHGPRLRDRSRAGSRPDGGDCSRFAWSDGRTIATRFQHPCQRPRRPWERRPGRSSWRRPACSLASSSPVAHPREAAPAGGRGSPEAHPAKSDLHKYTARSASLRCRSSTSSGVQTSGAISGICLASA